MPKVGRKDAEMPLQEAAPRGHEAVAMPDKPAFSALTAAEQSDGKLELRRVSHQQPWLPPTCPSKPLHAPPSHSVAHNRKPGLPLHIRHLSVIASLTAHAADLSAVDGLCHSSVPLANLLYTLSGVTSHDLHPSPARRYLCPRTA